MTLLSKEIDWLPGETTASRLKTIRSLPGSVEIVGFTGALKGFDDRGCRIATSTLRFGECLMWLRASRSCRTRTFYANTSRRLARKRFFSLGLCSRVCLRPSETWKAAGVATENCLNEGVHPKRL